jgi:mycothiol synthase
MALRRRTARIRADLPAMQLLAARHPGCATHATDLPYRLSWEGDADDVAGVLWEEDGRLVGWAVWLPGNWGMECAADPAHAAALYPEMLAWSADRAAEFAASRSEPTPHWWVYARSQDAARIAALEAAGFEQRDWHNVRFERSLAEEPPAPVPPEGFTVRPLAGEAEVPAYVAVHRAAFNSTYMTEPRRRRTLSAPGYRPDLDLVAVAQDGRVVAFAVLWLGPDGEGQFEPVGTHPDFQRRGLARALLLEGMRRLRAAGATRAAVETDHNRRAAPELYGSLMTRAAYTTLPFTKAL